MELSSPRFKSVAVSVGFSLWFFVITSAIGIFSLETFGIFVMIIFTITQVFTFKLSKVLDRFAILNTKIFLGILFIMIISIYGMLFKLLKIDLLRLKKYKETYWLEIERVSDSRILKQY